MARLNRGDDGTNVVHVNFFYFVGIAIRDIDISVIIRRKTGVFVDRSIGVWVIIVEYRILILHSYP